MACVDLVLGSILAVTLFVNQAKSAVSGVSLEATQSYPDFLQTFKDTLDTSDWQGVENLTDTHTFFWYSVQFGTQAGWSKVLSYEQKDAVRFVLTPPLRSHEQDNPKCTGYLPSGVPSLHITFPGFTDVQYVVGGNAGTYIAFSGGQCFREAFGHLSLPVGCCVCP